MLSAPGKQSPGDRLSCQLPELGQLVLPKLGQLLLPGLGQLLMPEPGQLLLPELGQPVLPELGFSPQPLALSSCPARSAGRRRLPSPSWDHLFTFSIYH